MRLTNSRETYGLVAQILHWLVAILIIALFIMGKIMHELPEATTAEINDKLFLYSLHKSVGIVAFGLSLLRILWALVNKHPFAINHEHKLEAFLASIVHWMLYISIILLPLTGWIGHAASDGFAKVFLPFGDHLPLVPKSASLSEFFFAIHTTLPIVLAISVGLHIAGALKHFFIDKDSILQRMVPLWYREGSVQVPSQLQGSKAPIFAALILYALILGAISLGAGQPHDHGHAGDDGHGHGKAATDDHGKVATDDHAHGQEATDDQGHGQEATDDHAHDDDHGYGPTDDQESAPQAGNWQVIAAQSALGIEVTQNGDPVNGSFGEWNAEIVFDPEKPEEASVTARIDIMSLTLGSVTSQALGEDILAAEAFPEAVFEAKGFTSLGEERYAAAGELTLKGITNPVTLEFDLKIENGKATMQGSTVLNRVDFGVGASKYEDESTIRFPVSVTIDITADRK